MRDDRISQVVIVGGGTAGWMTAAAVSKIMGASPDLEISLVESDEIGTVGVGEATVPHIRFFNASLGIGEADFMAHTKATFKLGIEFQGWGRPGESYMHAFGQIGQSLDLIEFWQYWLRARREGVSPAAGPGGSAVAGGWRRS